MMAELALGDGIAVLEGRTKVVKALLVVGFLLAAATLAGEVGELGGGIDLGNPDPSGPEQLYGLVLLSSLLVTLVTIVAFSMWIYRAAANVVAAGVAGFDFTPGWAVGWYFVPFANLVQPFIAMRQIWNASLGDQGDLDRGHIVLTLWWTSWLLSNILSNISAQIAWRMPESYETSIYLGIAASLFSLILLPVGYHMIDRIAQGQRERLTAAHIFA